MARPKSEDKRIAILNAATQLIAERGLNATPTSEISRRAAVAEGTLFTYFATKEILVNALYCQIKTEIAQAVMTDFPSHGSVEERLRFIWNRQIDWGRANDEKRAALAQLQVCELLSEGSIQAGTAPFAEVFQIAVDAIAQGLIAADVPMEFIGKAIASLLDATTDLMAARPELAETYRSLGFSLFWNGITLHSSPSTPK